MSDNIIFVIQDEFLKNVKSAAANFYGEDPQKSEDFGRIVTHRHFRWSVANLKCLPEVSWCNMFLWLNVDVGPDEKKLALNLTFARLWSRTSELMCMLPPSAGYFINQRIDWSVMPSFTLFVAVWKNISKMGTCFLADKWMRRTDTFHQQCWPTSSPQRLSCKRR